MLSGFIQAKHVSGPHFFLLLNNIPLYGHDTFCLSTYLSVDGYLGYLHLEIFYWMSDIVNFTLLGTMYFYPVHMFIFYFFSEMQLSYLVTTCSS